MKKTLPLLLFKASLPMRRTDSSNLLYTTLAQPGHMVLTVSNIVQEVAGDLLRVRRYFPLPQAKPKSFP